MTLPNFRGKQCYAARLSDVATTDETALPAPSQKAPATRPFWHLEIDDKRTLYITILGGLAANIGAVLIIGLGLVEAHLIHRYRHTLPAVLLPQAGFVAVNLVLGFASSSFSKSMPGGDRSKGDLLARRISLGLVGLAAGVK
jgi:hypothetical protein